MFLSLFSNGLKPFIFSELSHVTLLDAQLVFNLLMLFLVLNVSYPFVSFSCTCNYLLILTQVWGILSNNVLSQELMECNGGPVCDTAIPAFVESLPSLENEVSVRLQKLTSFFVQGLLAHKRVVLAPVDISKEAIDEITAVSV